MKGTSSIILLLLAACLSAWAAPSYRGGSSDEETQQEGPTNEAGDYNNPRPADLIEAADASDPAKTYQLRHTLNMNGGRYTIFTKVKKDGSLEHQATRVSKNSVETVDRQPEAYSSTAVPLEEASEQLLKKELGEDIQNVNEDASLNDTRRGPVYDCAYKVWNDTATAQAESKIIYRVLPCRPSGLRLKGHGVQSAMESLRIGSSNVGVLTTNEPTCDGTTEQYMTCEFKTDQALRQVILQKAELYIPQLSDDGTPPNAHEADARSAGQPSQDNGTTQDPEPTAKSIGNGSSSVTNPTADEASSIETSKDEDSQFEYKYKNVGGDQSAPPKEQPPVNFLKLAAAKEKSAPNINDVRGDAPAAGDNPASTEVVNIAMYKPHRKAPFQFGARATDGHCGPALDVLKMLQRWQRRAFDPSSIEIRLPMAAPDCAEKTDNCADGQCLPHGRVYLLLAYAEKADDEEPATMAPEVMKEFLDIILSRSMLG
ncbi:hypothetical protein Bbelb_169730 [Branchiostoma belcheri]|nr:hypothetical protein Bbelb_169730 [Branchiostoma belcheri]